tara:strand:+ start:221 stop:373 length:153 start_codon:yes stop_codon:yes gene_type:complete
MINLSLNKDELDVLRQALIDSLNHNVDVNDTIAGSLLADVSNLIKFMKDK